MRTARYGYSINRINRQTALSGVKDQLAVKGKGRSRCGSGVDFMNFINIGFGNMVSSARLIAIVSPESAPIKRIVQDAREQGRLIDATYGRRTRAVIVMDSDHVILSAVQPETIAARLDDNEEELQDEE